MITDDAQLARLYTSGADGRRALKPLQELLEDGIITVSDRALEHAALGDWISPSKQLPNGRLKNGGHGAANMAELERREIRYVVEKTYSNGVRIGGVENHRNRLQRIGTFGQAWFPNAWSEDDIIVAATSIANAIHKADAFVFGEYNGVRVGVFCDSVNGPTTIFPDNSRQPFNGAWEVTNIG